jgi:hypothetical protein
VYHEADRKDEPRSRKHVNVLVERSIEIQPYATPIQTPAVNTPCARTLSCSRPHTLSHTTSTRSSLDYPDSNYPPRGSQPPASRARVHLQSTTAPPKPWWSLARAQPRRLPDLGWTNSGQITGPILRRDYWICLIRMTPYVSLENCSPEAMFYWSLVSVLSYRAMPSRERFNTRQSGEDMEAGGLLQYINQQSA